MQEDESIKNYNLSTRAKNTLLRAGIKTISMLQAMRREEVNGLIAIKNCGAGTLAEIIDFWESQFLNKGADSMQIDEGIEKNISTKQQGACGSKKTIPDTDKEIKNLPLSGWAKNALSQAGINTVNELRLLAGEIFLRIKQVSVIKSDVFIEIMRFCENQGWCKNIAEGMTPTQFAEYLISSFLDKRDCQVICERWGLRGKAKKTLEELGHELNLTRERVRQVQANAERKLDRVAHKIVKEWLLKTYENRVRLYLSTHAGMARVDEILLSDKIDDDAAIVFLSSVAKIRLAPDSRIFPSTDKMIFIGKELAEKFPKIEEDLMRIVTSKGCPVKFDWVFSELCHYGHDDTSDFIKRCLEVSENVRFDRNGDVCLCKWDFFDPKNIPEMAEKALLQIGQPAHFTHIVDVMNGLFPERAPFNIHSVHGCMIKRTSKFVCVGRGIYALKNWGIKRRPYIKDFLVQEITNRGGIAQIDDLIAVGQGKYGYKATSIRMTLSMNPRLFKSVSCGFWKLV